MVRQRRDESVPYWQSSQKSGVFTGQCKVHQALRSLESIEPSSVRFLLPMQGCSIKHVSHLESLEPSSVRFLYCECKGVASSTSVTLNLLNEEPSSLRVSNCQCREVLFASSTSTNHLNPSSKSGFLLPTFSTKKDESQPHHTLPLVSPECAY